MTDDFKQKATIRLDKPKRNQARFMKRDISKCSENSNHNSVLDDDTKQKK